LEGLKESSGSTFKGSSGLFELFNDSYDEYQLELIVDLGHSLLSYRWVGSPVSSHLRGKIPIARPTRIKIGKPLPTLSVTSLERKLQDISRFRDRVVVMNWWATSCPPCIEEIPELNKLVDEYAGRGVIFVAVAWNNEQEINDFLKTHRFNYSHFLFNKAAQSIFGASFPRNVVVGRNGIVAYDFRGVDGAIAAALGQD
jgi:thiol-disulfide isomerase/thioredoxin